MTKMRALMLLAMVTALAGPVAKAAAPVRDCSDCPMMVAIPAGSFSMGSSAPEIEWSRMMGAPPDLLKRETPAHKVALKAFSMSATEITRDQFERFVRATGHVVTGSCLVSGPKGEFWSRSNNWRSPGYPQQGDHPVVCIGWNDAMAYTVWLSEQSQKLYRLPSEAEWEYAARAGTTAGRYWGWDVADACRHANVANLGEVGRPAETVFPCGDGYTATAPVGRFRANAFGLHDMLGNVMEWTADCYHDSYVDAPTDGSAWVEEDCPSRVLRSSSFGAVPWATRSAHRGTGGPGLYSPVGFRVVRTD